MNKKLGTTVTEGRIVEAAVQLFVLNGSRGISTRDISRVARVSEVTLSLYFPRKADLLCAPPSPRLSCIRMGRELQSKLAADEPPQMAVRRLIEFFLENFFKSPGLAQLILFWCS